ncbi:hypothetical protein [Sinorhizobium terangae]|uniref:hypothetical protein n=1 Tax=Sinorhizobium terangae TaxID=110322 RepID=UPI0024B0C143|nr:hypothetical protein [Sinorhizobium terangae]WFU51978.1 hypothetical protein QA637_29190 [Sinorhizobium terangae]
MPSILVPTVSERARCVADNTNIDVFLFPPAGEPDNHPMLFPAHDSTQRAEADDVAVVPLEFPPFFQGRLRGSVIDRAAEGKLSPGSTSSCGVWLLCNGSGR